MLDVKPDVWGLSLIPKLHIKKKERTKFPKLCSAMHTEAHMHTCTYAHSQIHLSKTKEKGRKEIPGCCGRRQKMQTFRPLSFPFKTSVVYTQSPAVSYKVTRVEEAASDSPMQLSCLE